MKWLIIRMIKIYRKLPIHTHAMCKFIPTCSEYALVALDRFGLFKGLYLSIKRILKCNPFNNGGYDPVPCGSGKKYK